MCIYKSKYIEKTNVLVHLLSQKDDCNLFSRKKFYFHIQDLIYKFHSHTQERKVFMLKTDR